MTVHRRAVTSRVAITVAMLAACGLAVGEHQATGPELAQLRELLGDAQEKTRISAAERLGETGSVEAVPWLVEAFAREPRLQTLRPRTVKGAILEALARIGGDKAKAALIGILNDYLARGPTYTKQMYDDEDYFGVVLHCLEALVRWHEDPEIAALLRAWALGERDEDKLHYTMREAAYRGWLLADMAQQGLDEPQERAAYLLPQLTGTGTGHWHDWAPDTAAKKTPEAMRNSAFVRLLVEQGPEALPAVKDELVSAPDDAYERSEALAKVIASICALAYEQIEAAAAEEE